MNGDRRPKMAALDRAIRWCNDCMKPRPRIKGSEKRLLRKLVRFQGKMIDMPADITRAVDEEFWDLL